ncbi:hypothetical protein NL676_029528 [Syzygium grande]|nr:hypothetical protein NL676_029528 [Syzygium grande]
MSGCPQASACSSHPRSARTLPSSPSLATVAGGKVAFALALGKSSTHLTVPFMALLGIDQVDGMDKGKKTLPPVLTCAPRSFGLDMPTMVVGPGPGEHKKNRLLPAHVPRGVNPADFFAECRPPARHFAAEKYGHMDMLDDDHEEDTPDIAPEETEAEFNQLMKLDGEGFVLNCGSMPLSF